MLSRVLIDLTLHQPAIPIGEVARRDLIDAVLVSQEKWPPGAL